MKTRLVVICLLVITVVFPLCKKSVDAQQLLLGKWKVDSVQVRTLVNNQIEYQTGYKPSSDYYDFRTQDTLYLDWMSQHYTISYRLVSLHGRSIIQFTYSADTILNITKRSLVLKDPQGSDSKVFLTKQWLMVWDNILNSEQWRNSGQHGFSALWAFEFVLCHWFAILLINGTELMFLKFPYCWTPIHVANNKFCPLYIDYTGRI